MCVSPRSELGSQKHSYNSCHRALDGCRRHPTLHYSITPIPHFPLLPFAGFAIAFDVALQFSDAVAAEFLQHPSRQLERYDGFTDDRRGGRGAYVVSRALARSKMSRVSWRSYLMRPARSRWQGRRLVTGGNSLILKSLFLTIGVNGEAMVSCGARLITIPLGRSRSSRDRLLRNPSFWRRVRWRLTASKSIFRPVRYPFIKPMYQSTRSRP